MSDIKALVQQRGVIKGQCTRLLSFLQDTDRIFQIDELESRKEKLEEVYKAFSDIQLSIELIETNPTIDEVERTQFESTYFYCSSLIKKNIRSLTASNSTPSTPQLDQNSAVFTIKQTNALLPKIEIRPFDGNPIEWYSFYDTFKSVVHDNTEIPGVQKFHYLKNALQGDISSVISSLNASDESYNVAWDLLRERCDKPRQIIQTHIKLLLDLPEIHKDSSANLRSLSERAQMHINALKALKCPVDHWDIFLVYIIIKKLDKNTRRAWERTLDNKEMPKLGNLIEFLNKQSRGDDMESTTLNASNTQIHKQFQKSSNRFQSYVGHSERKSTQCTLCKQKNHLIYTCQEFLQLTPLERFDRAKKNSLCLNCLRDNHSTNKCLSKGCKTCNRKHNSLLHFVEKTKNETTEQEQSAPHVTHNDLVNQGTVRSYTATFDSEILLGTARVIILDKYKNEHECRVLLDGGSQPHFITQKLAEKLKLNKLYSNVLCSGLGQAKANAQYSVKATIKSKTSPFSSEVTLVTLPSITGLLPTRQIKREQIQIPKNIKLADPEFHKPAEIDLLIGSALFYNLLEVGQIKVPHASNLVIQKTSLGWIIAGEINQRQSTNSYQSCHLITLEKQLNKFWELEEIPVKTYYSKEEEFCENHFADNVKRDDTGKYIVRLPFNEDKKLFISDSYRTALKRFNSLETKFANHQELQTQYIEFLREYESLGHMTDITGNHNNGEGYYLPHHAVFKESSATTKIRVVFDGSAKSTSNISLNDTLMVGPTIQDDLVSIIMRFRLHKYVLTADIEKMFRQILVDQRDSIYQKILWRTNKTESLKVFRLNTVTYGTTTAPFLAVRCLKQLALDEGKYFPLASPVLTNDFYMDDLLTGSNSLDEALELKIQLIGLLKRAGFNLRQWSSNESLLVHEVYDTDIKEGDKRLSERTLLDSEKSQKILGIQWSPVTDTISYSIKFTSESNRVSKRIILSHIAQLFDPLGLLGPIITYAKLIMQELWKVDKLSWDASVPQSLYTTWTNFKSELPLLDTFRMPRKVMLDDATDIQLHGFCDASERAYGACIYLRCKNDSGQISVWLICSKSRVAPIKSITLPRLELCAANLLSKLYVSTLNSLRRKINKTYLWSDSSITLNWINTSPHSLKTFVANRVSEIQSNTEVTNWHHVSTYDNPADLISRGQMPSQFLKPTIWLKGPSWLQGSSEHFKTVPLITEEVPEQRTRVSLVNIQGPSIFFERFSSITSLNRFVAYCMRYIKNFKCTKEGNLDNSLRGELTADEIRDAHFRIIKLIQPKSFLEEIKAIKNNKCLYRKNRISTLNPFIDHEGIIRAGGRIKNAPISFDQKHPILLPKSHHITKLIIRESHIKNYHSGVQATLNYVRQNYWPLDGKNTTRLIIHKCIRCFKMNPKTPSYVMGNLPRTRVVPSRPFENVGVDYCGPFMLKEKKYRNRSKIKAYVVVFVCFATKAIHLELVTDLTTESCLAAIKRFFARRGISRNIYSDNATNFIGSKNEIYELKKHLLSSKHNKLIAHSLADQGVNWHFIPPRSPHFGGLWEASVKSFKRHLYRTVGNDLFTFEQFYTFIVEIEGILNSRPLTPLSSDPNDLLPLTPGHFLIGDLLKGLPEHDFKNAKVNKLSLWQHIQKMKQHFWQRWHKEYLNELQTRGKWHLGNADIKVGTLVVVKEDNVPPMQWLLGRIVGVQPGDDNIVRVATVKTVTGTYKRSVKSLCPLPLDII